MNAVFATGADERYGYHLLNLLGSLKANSDVFDRVVAYDLGLTQHQRGLLDAVEGVEVRTVPAFTQNWARGFTWKPWIWTHLDAGEVVFWLDAGDTILRSLGPALDQIRERGYFLVSQGNPLRNIVPSDFYDLYELAREQGEREHVAAGIIGFRVGSPFYEEVIVSVYEDCLAGRSLGFSPDEVAAFNLGLHRMDDPPLRDCLHFRWDQSVLNARLFAAIPDAFVNDLDEYGGYRTARDHPRQVIWNHRRRGNMAYLARVPYRREAALRGRAFGVVFRLRWWRKMHERLFEPSTYVLKARKLARSLRAGPA
jgi:hypothetical protein